jgi:RNA polymerase sigma factor (sigma-70 family)
MHDLGEDRTEGVNAATALYAEHRQTLFAVVYDMLGTVTDTEDVLQETWVSWASAHRPGIASPRGYLLRIAVNEALARLRSVRRCREAYVGPWLPEPVLTCEDQSVNGMLRTEAASFGMLVVLETLSPLERAVFVLREAFGFDYGEIADILQRSPEAVRQVARRARDHVTARQPRYNPDPSLHRAVTERFVSAALGGDIPELMRLLAPDVALWTDGGGKLRAALNVIEGSDKIARLVDARSGLIPAGIEWHVMELNGAPAIAAFASGRLYGVLIAELDAAGERIVRLYMVLNPEKLAALAGAVARSRQRPGEGDRDGLQPVPPQRRPPDGA